MLKLVKKKMQSKTYITFSFSNIFVVITDIKNNTLYKITLKSFNKQEIASGN